MATPQESSKFLTLFLKAYKQAYGQAIRINRNTAKWAARDILDSYGWDDCARALDWACRVRSDGFTWDWYATNVGRLIDAYEQYEKDVEMRKALRKQAREWLGE